MPAFDEFVRSVDEITQQVELMVNNAISTWTSHAGHTIGRGATIAKLTKLDTVLANASSRIRTYMNNLAPVHRLPPEILSHIFTLVLAESGDPRNHRNRASLLRVWGLSAIGPPSHLVPFMKVCRRWNETLTQNATFWTVVQDDKPQEFNNPPSYTNYLHRNLDGPLSVTISPFPTASTMNLLWDSSSRVKELSVDGTGVRTNITRLTSSPLLSLAASSLMKCVLRNIHSDSPSLLLFQGGAPRLAYLWLYTLSWVPSNTFPSLTHLIVGYGGNIPTLKYSFANLLAFLEGSPRLQVLYLSAVGTAKVKEVPEPGTVFQRIQLMHLRKLSVAEPQGRSHADHFQVAVCSHIDRPADCLVYLSIHGTSGLGHLVESLSLPRLSNLCIFTPNFEPNATLLPMSLQLADDQRSMGVWLRLDLSLRALPPVPGQGVTGSADRREVFYAAVTGHGLFHNVEMLDITWYALSYMLEIPSIFKELASLKTLVFDRIRRSVSPAKALSILRPMSDATECRTVLFPQLVTLALKVKPPVGLEELHDILRARREAGHGIEDLVLVFNPAPEVPTAEELHTLTQLRREANTLTVYGAYGEHHSWPKSLAWEKKLPKECFSDTSLLWPSWV